jgi:hypothetical protein
MTDIAPPHNGHSSLAYFSFYHPCFSISFTLHWHCVLIQDLLDYVWFNDVGNSREGNSRDKVLNYFFVVKYTAPRSGPWIPHDRVELSNLLV